MKVIRISIILMIFTQRVNSQTHGFDIIKTRNLCFITELRGFRIREEDDECQVVCNYSSWLCRASCQGTAAAAVCCSVLQCQHEPAASRGALQHCSTVNEQEKWAK